MPLNGACWPALWSTAGVLPTPCLMCTSLRGAVHFLLPWSVAGLRFMLTRAVPPLFKIVAPSCTAFSFGAWSPFDLARCGLSSFPRLPPIPRRTATSSRDSPSHFCHRLYHRRALRPIVEEARSLSHLSVGLVLEFILESLDAPTDRSLQ